MVPAFGQAQRGGDFGMLIGHVVNATNGEPVPFVPIEVHMGDSLWASITDHDGMYVIRLPKGRASIRTDKEDYLTFQGEMDIDWRKLSFLDIRLDPVKKLP